MQNVQKLCIPITNQQVQHVNRSILKIVGNTLPRTCAKILILYINIYLCGYLVRYRLIDIKKCIEGISFSSPLSEALGLLGLLFN